MKEDLTKERDDLLQEIVRLREAMSEAQGRIAQMEAEQDDNQQKIQEVRSYVDNAFVYDTCCSSNNARDLKLRR